MTQTTKAIVRKQISTRASAQLTKQIDRKLETLALSAPAKKIAAQASKLNAKAQAAKKVSKVGKRFIGVAAAVVPVVVTVYQMIPKQDKFTNLDVDALIQTAEANAAPKNG